MEELKKMKREEVVEVSDPDDCNLLWERSRRGGTATFLSRGEGATVRG